MFRRKREAGSPKPEAGRWKLAAGNRKPAAGSRKREAGSRTPEAGGWKPLLALPLLAAIAAGGCASAHAKGQPDMPALNVPTPPPRIVEAAEAPPEPVAELPTPPPVSGAPRSTPARPPAPKPAATEAKPETKPDPPVEPPPSPPPVAAAPPQLRTPQTADTSSAAKVVRTTIDTAWSILNGVNFGPLSAPRKKAYNDAKLFLQQAEDALKAGNLAFAKGVATKAETLAKELAGR